MKKKTNSLSLERRLLRVSHLPDIACGIILLMYTVFIMNLNFATHYLLILVVIAGILFAQFFVSGITNHFLMGKVSKEVERWESEDITMEERTRLFLNIHRLPARKQTEAIVFFVICSILLTVAYQWLYKINYRLNIVSFISCLLGSYVAALLAYSNTRNICNDYARRLVDEGVDEKLLSKRNYFGMSYYKTFVSFLMSSRDSSRKKPKTLQLQQKQQVR